MRFRLWVMCKNHSLVVSTLAKLMEAPDRLWTHSLGLLWSITSISGRVLLSTTYLCWTRWGTRHLIASHLHIHSRHLYDIARWVWLDKCKKSWVVERIKIDGDTICPTTPPPHSLKWCRLLVKWYANRPSSSYSAPLMDDACDTLTFDLKAIEEE